MKIGIDLGTTNSALAWIDPREAEDLNFPPIHIFEVPQLVAPGKTEPRRTLPSFMFLEDGRPIGVYAREQGAIVPTRLVHSAKSWLSNPEVDRTAKILPWDSQETGRVLSPVEVSSEFLRRFRDGWDKQHATPLADEDIVLTVPASFDEEARELTVMAAAEAGLPKLTLLEEPAAAFYSWIANNFERSRKLLHDGDEVRNVERLLEGAHRAELVSHPQGVVVGEGFAPGHGDDPGLRELGAKRGDGLHPVLPWHEDIGDDDVGRLVALDLQPYPSVRRDGDRETLRFQEVADQLGEVLVVVYDQYASHGG